MWGPSHFCQTAHGNMAREWCRMKCAIGQNGIIQDDPITTQTKDWINQSKKRCRHSGAI